MNCRKVEFLLSENLSQADLHEVDEHLTECPSCRRLLQELEAMESLNFSLARMTEAPVDFSRRVTTRLARRRWRRTSWTVAAALGFLVVGLSGLMMVQTPAGERRASVAVREAQTLASPQAIPGLMILADPTPADLEEVYLEVILGEPLRSSSWMSEVPSEIKVHRTDMGRVNLTHVSH